MRIPPALIFVLLLIGPLARAFGQGGPVKRTRLGDLDSVLVAPEPGPLPMLPVKPPQFPDDLRRNGEEAIVVVAAIIDTTGRIERGSASFVRITNPKFRQTVCTWLGQVRFEPPRDGDALRRALVFIPLAFEIASDRSSAGEPSVIGYQRTARSMSRDSLGAQLSRLPGC